MLRIQHLVAGTGVGVAQKADNLVTAHTTNDLLCLKLVHFGDGVAQAGVIRGRVAVQVACFADQCLAGAVGRTKGIFV